MSTTTGSDRRELYSLLTSISEVASELQRAALVARLQAASGNVVPSNVEALADVARQLSRAAEQAVRVAAAIGDETPGAS